MRNKIDHFKDQLEPLQKKYKIPGLSFIILHDNNILNSEGLGYADIDNKIEAKANTQYRIASLTKPISAAIILKLVERGK